MRNLDYYTGIVFEVMSPNLGYNICGGGRYDKLLSRFGVESIPAVGFAIGMERLRLAVNGGQSLDRSSKIKIYLEDVNDLDKSFELIDELQDKGFETLIEYENLKVDNIDADEIIIKIDDIFAVFIEKEERNFERIAEVLEYVRTELENSNA